jgi:hypothetical protein
VAAPAVVCESATEFVILEEPFAGGVAKPARPIVRRIGSESPGQTLALRASPNPSSGTVRLTVSTTAPGTLVISVYDQLGRMLDGGEPIELAMPGTYELPAAIGRLRPRAYTAVARMGGRAADARFAVVR